MALTLPQAKRAIDAIFNAYRPVASGTTVLPRRLTAGKVYEAWVLADVLKRLSAEGYVPTLVAGYRVRLRATPGPIDRSYAFFSLTRTHDGNELELWTDVEFLTLSHDDAGRPPPERGHYHELDIVAVEPGTTDRPAHDEVVLGVECKATAYTKAHLRAILGVRRELSLLAHPAATRFAAWPRPTVPANPNSCLLTYSTDARVLDLDAPGGTFGIDFLHLPPP